jgi:peptide deformylase
MKLPVVIYGDPVLKQPGNDINKDYPRLKELISSMFETMYAANGVGLAAQQIGLAIRVFVIDASKYDDKIEGPKKVFINPEIIDESQEVTDFEEGCLSIPGIRSKISRPKKIVINYLDENFIEREEEFDDIVARIIQHEYDHIEGKLFIEKLPPLKKTLIKGKLNDISNGKFDVDYKTKVFNRKRR